VIGDAADYAQRTSLRLDEGLLAYWPLDGTLFDHGGVAAMYAYNGGEGIVNGRDDATGSTTTGVTYETGVVGSAIVFSNGGHAVLADAVPTGTLLDFEGKVELSISYWAKGSPSAQTESYVDLFSTNHLTNFGIVHQAHVPTIGQTSPLAVHAGVAPNCGCNFGEVIDGSWHHLVFTRSASAAICYVDGAVSNQVDGTCQPMVMMTTQNVQIAADNNDGGNRHFVGSMDELKIWGRALSAEEAAAEYRRR
jgi:hypothetical protein